MTTNNETTALLLDVCPTEDSVDCWWDATVHGNGEGLSFVNFDGTYQVIELPAGHHLTDVYVIEHIVEGGYSGDDWYEFQWLTTPNTTTVSTPPASLPVDLAHTGPVGIVPIVIIAAALIAMGVTAMRLRRSNR